MLFTEDTFLCCIQKLFLNMYRKCFYTKKYVCVLVLVQTISLILSSEDGYSGSVQFFRNLPH